MEKWSNIKKIMTIIIKKRYNIFHASLLGQIFFWGGVHLSKTYVPKYFIIWQGLVRPGMVRPGGQKTVIFDLSQPFDKLLVRQLKLGPKIEKQN